MRTYVNTFSNVTTKVLTYSHLQSLTQGFGLGPGKDSVRHVISPSQVRPAAPQFIWHDIGYEEYGFKEKHYLIPYSSSELRSNPNLKQNPGW